MNLKLDETSGDKLRARVSSSEPGTLLPDLKTFFLVLLGLPAIGLAIRDMR